MSEYSKIQIKSIILISYCAELRLVLVIVRYHQPPHRVNGPIRRWIGHRSGANANNETMLTVVVAQCLQIFCQDSRTQ